MRQDPNVIMVGEMREQETIRLTLNAAETGQLVLSTLHSSNTADALQRIASVMSGGNVRVDSEIEEDVILSLEREAFIDFLKQEKTLARIDHTLKTGKPLRN